MDKIKTLDSILKKQDQLEKIYTHQLEVAKQRAKELQLSELIEYYRINVSSEQKPVFIHIGDNDQYYSSTTCNDECIYAAIHFHLDHNRVRYLKGSYDEVVFEESINKNIQSNFIFRDGEWVNALFLAYENKILGSYYNKLYFVTPLGEHEVLKKFVYD